MIKGNKSILLLEKIVFHHQQDAVLNVVLEEVNKDLGIIQIKTKSNNIQIIKQLHNKWHNNNLILNNNNLVYQIIFLHFYKEISLNQYNHNKIIQWLNNNRDNTNLINKDNKERDNKVKSVVDVDHLYLAYDYEFIKFLYFL